MRVFALLALCFAAVAAVPANPQRIVGGTEVDISEFPSIVALLYSSTSNNYRQTCAGTIINNRSVLTAAHCTFGDSASRWRSRVGSTYANSGGTVYNTYSILNHPDYNRNTYDNDISIIRIFANIAQGIARPASIPGSNYNLIDRLMVMAAGWGATHQGGSNVSTLRFVQNWIVNQNACRNRFAEIGRTITANMVCSGWMDVGGRDQCHGDSGGPLYHNYRIVVGVSSWGQGCGQAEYPSVNTRVSRYTSWIRNNA